MAKIDKPIIVPPSPPPPIKDANEAKIKNEDVKQPVADVKKVTSNE